MLLEGDSKAQDKDCTSDAVILTASDLEFRGAWVSVTGDTYRQTRSRGFDTPGLKRSLNPCLCFGSQKWRFPC